MFGPRDHRDKPVEFEDLPPEVQFINLACLLMIKGDFDEFSIQMDENNNLKILGDFNELNNLGNTTPGKIVDRLKTMANLDLSITHQEQHGFINMKVRRQSMSLAVHTIPSDNPNNEGIAVSIHSGI